MLRRFLFLLTLPLCAGLFAQAPPARQFLLQIEPVRPDFAINNVTAEEMPVLQAHGAYLHELLAAGKLITAGQAFQPKRLFGIIVVEAPDAAAAQAILDADPAVKNKVFRGEVIPYRTVVQRQPAAPKTN
ncbi:YciI family protein [Paludibaculum fermentans]|uniref:YciI family protein n=1 Tax=Paludibaculum fermentans TaxID=1473598 RepID=UPI003EBCA567